MTLTGEGRLFIKCLGDGGHFQFHHRFGWTSQKSIEKRNARHQKKFAHKDSEKLVIGFSIQGKTVTALSGCHSEKCDEVTWKLTTPIGVFLITDEFIFDEKRWLKKEEEHNAFQKSILLSLAFTILVLSFFFLNPAPLSEEQVLLPEIPIKVVVPEKEIINVEIGPSLTALAKVDGSRGGSMVTQELGFLSLVGDPNLKKALGGTPLELKEVSPGVGPGGLSGSGGELLVGLGEGVKKTTVGNTGVSGLGGIGGTGPGGGEGGKGFSLLGSGGVGNYLNGVGSGRSLSDVVLAKDIILEGGLSRNVIQATIAKYLSEIRACYENGLIKNPGLTGQVDMHFEITASGSLQAIHVLKSTLHENGVESCMANRMVHWAFPKPLGGVVVKVNYPFLLRPVKHS